MTKKPRPSTLNLPLNPLPKKVELDDNTDDLPDDVKKLAQEGKIKEIFFHEKTNQKPACYTILTKTRHCKFNTYLLYWCNE